MRRAAHRWLRLALLPLAALAAAATCAAREAPLVAGIVWQLHEDAPEAQGTWHRLGARELLVQWTALDGVAFVRGTGLRESKRRPDWRRIARQPWAERILVGLAGRSEEAEARRSVEALVEQSLRIAKLRFPFEVSGWYFPVEADPTWKEAPDALPAALRRLPRPLWISAYDRNSLGARAFAEWVDGWLPDDVGVLFQDSVGVHARTPAIAREYADALAARLGAARVRLIAEAFRAEGERFRPATAAELRQQLAAYRGLPVYLFDGPHYVSERLVEEVLPP